MHAMTKMISGFVPLGAVDFGTSVTMGALELGMPGWLSSSARVRI